MISGRLHDTAMKLRQEDAALSLRQFGAAYNLGYARIKQLRGMHGFPLIAGKVIPSDFDQWRKEQAGLRSQRPANPPRSVADTTRALTSRSDSRVAWRLIENSLRDAVASLGLPAKSENNDV